MNNNIPKTTVLAYHNILHRGALPTQDKGCIPLERLDEHIQVMNDEGYVNISFQEAFDRLIQDDDYSAELSYAITFDDGYQNLFTYLPELLDKIKPTIFHITEYTGKSNLTWNTRTPVIQNHLTLEQIICLNEKGVDIQFHGVDHHNLLKFDDSKLHYRFQKGVDWFQKYLHKKPKFISYPYGYCDARITKIAAQYFSGGVTVTHGAWRGSAAKHALNRISVPFYLTGKNLVNVIRTPPAKRWMKNEQYAPWRRK